MRVGHGARSRGIWLSIRSKILHLYWWFLKTVFISILFFDYKKKLCKIYYDKLNINNFIFDNDFHDIMRFFHIFQVYLIRKYFKILLSYLIYIKYPIFMKFFINLLNYKSIKAIKSHFLLIFSSCHNLIVIIWMLACDYTFSSCL